MSFSLTSKVVNQVVVPGSLLWKREKRALLRRWKRAMLLPETILLAAVIIGGSYASDHFGYRPGGQVALAAASAVVQDGVPAPGAKRKQRILQDRLRDHPQELMALTSGDVVRAFEYPDFQRQDGPTTMLQFRGKECVLDVYMQNARPVHYEFRSRMTAVDGVVLSGDSDIGGRACIDDILRARRV